ncbi:MAG TPA: hypothetical protein VN088_08525 [Nocardioides sp.]|nr:hypothetical protein [Nocardioides sp.]
MLIRHKATLHELSVPDNYNPDAFKDYEPVAGPDAPPRSGRGSGTEAWASYAASNGVAVEDGASRDDIIAALDEAGVPTE